MTDTAHRADAILGSDPPYYWLPPPDGRGLSPIIHPIRPVRSTVVAMLDAGWQCVDEAALEAAVAEREGDQ